MFDLFFLAVLNLIKYEKDKYVLNENKFTKNFKMSFEDFIIYIIGNRGKTSVLEIDDFFKIRYRDIFERVGNTITKQNLSKRRIDISPLFFKDSNKMGLKEMFSNGKYDLKKFKGLNVFNIDGSQAKIPNTPITREEFEVDQRALKETKTPKARISIMSDAKNEVIIDSIITSMKIGESALAQEHIETADEIVDLSESIIIFDRLYASVELIV